MANIKTRYAIITTYFGYGSKTEWTEKENVRNICEKEKEKIQRRTIEKEILGLQTDTYIRVEVVNTDTGEIREYWNNHENKINF